MIQIVTNYKKIKPSECVTMNLKQLFACKEFKRLLTIPFTYERQEKVKCERLNNFVFGLRQKSGTCGFYYLFMSHHFKT